MALFTLYREGYLKFLNSPFILIHFVIFCKIMYFSSLFKWKWSLCNVCLVLNIESWNLMKALTGLNIWLNAPFNIKIGRICIYIYIYIYKVLISFVCLSFCLFIFPIITQEPVADLPQILIGELGRPMEMFLVWFWDFILSGSTFVTKV